MSAKCGHVLLIIPALVLASAASELKGVVTDSEDAVIRGAFVIVHWDRSGTAVGLKSNAGLKQDLILETDAKGEFGAELPPGFYDVFVAATAFSPECRKVRIKVGERATYSPKLKADPLVTNETGDTFPDR